MQFQFSFKHMESSPALQTHAEQKLRERIEKFVSKPISAHLTFSVTRHDHTIHLNLEAGDGFNVQVEHTSADMYAGIDELAEKLTTKLRKHKEKLKDHKGSKLAQTLRVADSPEATEPPVDAAEILKFEQGKRRISR